MHRNGRRNATGTVVYNQTTTSVLYNDTCMHGASVQTDNRIEVKVFPYLIINRTQVHIEEKKGKYSVEYSLASASDGSCRHGWGPTLKMEFPRLRFSTLTTGVA